MTGPQHLLDTDIAIEVLRKRDRRLVDRMRSASTVALSTISLYELRLGAERSTDPARNNAAVDELAGVVEVVDFTPGAASASAAIRAELARVGKPIGPYDLMIAGHARALSLTLVTRNLREFRRVRGLSVEKW
ncbi:MAG TPA: PIN domain-containing protein [Marmoricola sp.]